MNDDAKFLLLRKRGGTSFNRPLDWDAKAYVVINRHVLTFNPRAQELFGFRNGSYFLVFMTESKQYIGFREAASDEEREGAFRLGAKGKNSEHIVFFSPTAIARRLNEMGLRGKAFPLSIPPGSSIIQAQLLNW
jgi:hypothetical protein